jgi:predicted SAM-dependent methyltransferase
MTKLHLGCGRKYLDGYVNIDFPDSEHTVQKDLIADVYADIHTLAYPYDSVDEIRLHHVFEHFSRPMALALLCRWRDWLKPGGVLRVETPDAMACFKQMFSPFTGFSAKQQVMRHLFGSHEAGWAVHADGWYEEKFRITLSILGYSNIQVAKTKWEMLRNIEVTATKTNDTLGVADYEQAAEKLLTMSAVSLKQGRSRTVPESERSMIRVWMDMWKSAYGV